MRCGGDKFEYQCKSEIKFMDYLGDSITEGTVSEPKCHFQQRQDKML